MFAHHYTVTERLNERSALCSSSQLRVRFAKASTFTRELQSRRAQSACA